jgi:hypothetical protein
MDDMQILHHLKRAHPHSISNLQGDQAVGESLLPLELRRDQRAAGQGLSDPLGILKSLDAREHRAGIGGG